MVRPLSADRARDPAVPASGGAVAYLVRVRLLDDADAAAAAVTVANGRHRGTKVVAGSRPAYFVKEAVGRDRVAALAHEAATYARLHEPAGGHRLGRYLLRVHDVRRGAIVLETDRGAKSLADHHARCGRYSAGLAAQFGDALGALHHLTRDWYPPATTAGAPRHVPGALSIHRATPAALRDLSAAHLELIRLVQGAPDFCRALDALRDGWRVDALIHGDVKAANAVVTRPRGPGAVPALKLIDWETAQPGDAGWDAGSMLAEYLAAWALTRIAPARRTAPDPLGRVQPAIRACWRAYARRMRLDASGAQRRLIRAVRYAGARLVQSAFERAQLSRRLPAEARTLLRLGGNVLAYPLEAAVRLAGIPLQAEPTTTACDGLPAPT